MSKSKEVTVKFEDVRCLRETEKGLLCLVGGDEHWIPKSQVSDDSEVFNADENNEGTLVVSEWIAREKGLV